MELTTDRLTIRPIQPGDKEAVFEYRSDSVTNQFQGWIPASLKEVEEFIARNPAQINQPDSWFQCVVIVNETGKLIGDIGLHFMGPDNRQTELGCTFHREFHSKGYATEALRAILDYLFGELNKHRIIISTDPENKSSMKLVERLGFTKEAHFRESLFINGTWVDDVIYGLLKREWRAAR